MRFPYLIFVALLFGSVVGLAKDVTSRFEEFASKVKIFNTETVLYDGPGLFVSWNSKEDGGSLDKEFALLTENVTLAEYQRLLKNADPHVRTLVLAGLFRQGNARALPLFYAFKFDHSETWPQQPYPSQVASLSMVYPLRPQTVGDVAWSFLKFYMDKAVRSERADNDFASYWEPRGHRKWNASWFAARLQVALHGSHPPSPECAPQVQAIRAQIDKLPPEDAALTLLWLRYDYQEDGPQHANMLITDRNLVRLLKQLGREKLFRILRKESLSDDPDLQPVSNNFRYGGVLGFPLQHASELFASEDAESLLVEGRKSFDRSSDFGELGQTPLWWVAASKLQPDKASEILHEGCDLLNKANHGSLVDPLMVLLWETQGDKETKFISDWFFASEDGKGPTRNARGAFLGLAKNSEKGRGLVTMLLNDPRASQCERGLLAEFAKIVNDWMPKPVVTKEEIRTMDGTWGKGGGPPPQDIPGILERLRASIPEWNK